MGPLDTETVDGEPGKGEAPWKPPLPWRFAILEGGLVTIWFYLVGSLVRWEAASWMDAFVLGLLWASYRAWESRGKRDSSENPATGDAESAPAQGEPTPLWAHYRLMAVPWSVSLRKVFWITLATLPMLLVYDRFFDVSRPLAHVALATAGIGVLYILAYLTPRLWLGTPSSSGDR